MNDKQWMDHYAAKQATPEPASEPQEPAAAAKVLWPKVRVKGVSREELESAIKANGRQTAAKAYGIDPAEIEARAELEGDNKRLRAALVALAEAADVYAADQSGATDPRCGVQQPISVAEGEELLAALKAAWRIARPDLCEGDGDA